MDSKWCTWCTASQQQWSATTACVVGDQWAYDNLQQKLQDIQQNTEMPPKERMGVKFKPILNVDPILFVLPPLHIKLGLVNRVFIKSEGYSDFSWSQIRIENIPTNERIGFNLYRNSICDLDDRLEDNIIFNINHLAEELDTLKGHLSDTRRWLKCRNLSQAEKNQWRLDAEIYQHEINEIQTKSREIDAAIKSARKRRTECKKIYEAEKKKRTYHSKLIQNKRKFAKRPRC